MSWDILPKANLQYFLQKLKGKLDAIRQGHVIKNSSGTSMTSRDDLQFVGTYVSDDSTNGKTKVNIVREFQSKAEIEALTGEAAKGFQHTPDTVYRGRTASDIGFDKTGTSFNSTRVQDVLEETDSRINKIDGRMFITKTSGTTYSIPLEKFQVNRNYGVALVGAWKDLFLIFFIGNNTAGITKLGGFDNSNTATISWNESTQSVEITFSYTVWDGITILPL